jgi:hypothetical protein
LLLSKFFGVILKPEEIAAYIGAAAWIPQIISWLYRAFVKPKLLVIPNVFGDIGFTSYGPIFNVRMAFLVENRDLIIDGLDLSIRHEDGESRDFSWAGLGETFSEITDSAGNKQIIGKDQTPIAIKVSTQSLLEKLVRFQEPRFHELNSELTQDLITHFNFLKQRNQDSFVSEVLSSKEYFSVVTQRQNWFWWKPGRYEVTLKPSSPQTFQLDRKSFMFEISSAEVDLLRKNLSNIEIELKNTILSNDPNAKSEPFSWHWVNVKTLRN